jgi:hypothetical protein
MLAERKEIFTTPEGTKTTVQAMITSEKQTSLRMLNPTTLRMSN